MPCCLECPRCYQNNVDTEMNCSINAHLQVAINRLHRSIQQCSMPATPLLGSGCVRSRLPTLCAAARWAPSLFLIHIHVRITCFTASQQESASWSQGEISACHHGDKAQHMRTHVLGFIAWAWCWFNSVLIMHRGWPVHPHPSNLHFPYWFWCIFSRQRDKFTFN